MSGQDLSYPGQTDGQTDKLTDRQTDGRTTQSLYATLQGHKNNVAP